MNRIELIINGSKFWYNPDDHSSIIKESGKFNSVHKGYDENNNIPVVIKKLNESLNRNQSAIERFKREFDFNVASPNLVQTTGYVFHKGSHYIIREYFEGIDLNKLKGSRLQLWSYTLPKYLMHLNHYIVTELYTVI